MIRYLALVLLFSASALNAQERYDLLITNGRVMDGSGNPWVRADVGVRGDRIVAVGDLAGATATRTIDATDRLVVPGFIDIHSHGDDTGDREETLRSDDARRRAAPNLVAQGVTTIVVNQDGRSQWPIAPQAEEMRTKGVGPNVALMIGHGTVRGQVLGQDYRRPSTDAEIARMKALVRQGMQEGAWGISAGLEYTPGRWSTTDEVVALVEEIVPFRGFYISHERSEGADPMWYWPSRDGAGPPTLLDAVSETIEIGERTGAVVVASHIKAKGAHYWGSSLAAVQLIEQARGRGVQVFADQYPYETSGSDGNTVLLPDWLFEDLYRRRRDAADGAPPADFAAALRAALADPATAAAVRQDIAHEIRRRGGAQNVVVFEYPDPAAVGKSIAELAEARGVSPVDMAIALQYEGDRSRPGGGRLRGFSMSEVDLDVYAAQPWTITASDAGIALPMDGSVHARYYGTFPRRIRHFALDRGVVTLEDAIRSMTTLPAMVMGLRNRGRIAEGAFADITILDLERVRDTATFFEPHQYAEGIDWVFVNGEPVVADGELTFGLPGRVLSPER